MSATIRSRIVCLPAGYPPDMKITIRRTVMFPVVLYDCDTWSFTLREDHRLGAFESAVLRKIFGPKRDKVTGDWRRSHNDEILICTAQHVLSS